MTTIRIDVSTRVRVDNLLTEAKTAWTLGNVSRRANLPGLRKLQSVVAALVVEAER